METCMKEKSQPQISRLRRQIFLGGVIGSMALPALASVDKAAYPAKPVRIIVSFPPGTGSDSSARFLARQLEQHFGQSFVVENRPGGNSFIAAEAVARAEPDGYTLFVASNSPMATNVVQFKSLPYDPVKDFAHVARLYYGAMVLSVSANSPDRKRTRLNSSQQCASRM